MTEELEVFRTREDLDPANKVVIATTVRNISNSEVTTWLACRLQYYYAFVRNLTPKQTPGPLARGTLGHEAFSIYIQARLDGHDHNQALKIAEQVWAKALTEGTSVEIVMETRLLFDRYMDYHEGWPQWELLGTEQRLDLPVGDTFSIPIRYDLMVREKHSGKILVGDFKFAYDFWRPEDHDINVQLPKYIQIMQANGINIQGGFLEEIRTRPLGKEKASDPKNLWRTSYYYPSPKKRMNTIRQHVAASLEIVDFRNLDDEMMDQRAIPVFNKFGACAYCNFKSLCISKLDGKTDLELDIATDFVENTYGYNKNELEITPLGELL